jgi:hypothetical protein
MASRRVPLAINTTAQGTSRRAPSANAEDYGCVHRIAWQPCAWRPGWVDHGGRGMPDDPGGAKALGPEALARAMRHRRWRAVHARRSRPAVSDRREPGSAEKKREPKRVHRLIVPATRRVTGASGAPFSDSLLCTRTHLRSGSTTGRQTRRATPRSRRFPPREVLGVTSRKTVERGYGQRRTAPRPLPIVQLPTRRQN